MVGEDGLHNFLVGTHWLARMVSEDGHKCSKSLGCLMIECLVGCDVGWVGWFGWKG